MCLNTSLEVGKSRARLIGSRCLVLCVSPPGPWGVLPRAVAMRGSCALRVPFCCWGRMELGLGIPCCTVRWCSACLSARPVDMACSVVMPAATPCPRHDVPRQQQPSPISTFSSCAHEESCCRAHPTTQRLLAFALRGLGPGQLLGTLPKPECP